MKKLFILTTLLFGIWIHGQENKQESYSFSMQEAINHAIQYNYQSINASRDIQSAIQKKWETTAAGLPQINANVGYMNNFRLQKSVVPAVFFGGNPGEFAEVEFGTKHTANGVATLSQLLFDGSYIVALQASKTYLEFYKNNKKKTDIDIKEMVIKSYGMVLLAQENVKILQKNKSNLEKTLFETNETYKNGLIEEENVEQLRITLEGIKSNLNYVTRLEGISKNMLKINLGMDLDKNLVLTDNLETLAIANMDLNALSFDFNVKNNINYLISENFVQQKSLELKLQKSKALPTLSANVNFGYNSFANSFSFFNGDQRYFNFSNLGVNLSVPIFSSFARSAKTQQSKIALEQATTQLTQAEQQLKLQYQNAKSDYEFSIEQYNSSKESLKLAERIEKKQNIKFTEGLSSSFDFTEAQRQLYTSQQNFLQNLVNVINKKAELEKITTN